MAGVRRNIVTNAAARDKYVQGVKLLKQDFTGPTTATLGIPGPATPVSTYDLFVGWHHIAMNTMTPPTQGDRNAAHRGPVFLPWHRFMLINLELQLQRVPGDQTFGLPYWDWAADGNLPAAQHSSAPIWGAQCMGGQGTPIATGPFAFNAADQNSWRVRIDVDVNGNLRSVNRGMRRAFAGSAPTLPKKSQVGTALSQSTYDASPWNTASPGFRNRLEGWRPQNTAPGLHNRVHVWVGGDMLPSSSPNDPVFYLNHCNVDRTWEAWLQKYGRTYVPPQSAPTDLLGHRNDDQMNALLSPSATPRQMLNASSFYTYDSLA